MIRILEEEKVEKTFVQVGNHKIINPYHQEPMAFLPLFTGYDYEPMWPIVKLSYVIFYVSITYELWVEIAEVEREKGMMLPEIFESYVEESDDGQSPCWEYSNNVDDELITKCVYARDLKGFAGHPGMMQGSENRAAWAYLQECPDEMKVALYWI